MLNHVFFFFDKLLVDHYDYSHLWSINTSKVVPRIAISLVIGSYY